MSAPRLNQEIAMQARAASIACALSRLLLGTGTALRGHSYPSFDQIVTKPEEGA